MATANYIVTQTISNSDGTLTISPTFGNVTASLDLSHANTWTGVQTFGNGNLALAGSTSGTTLLEASAAASGTITFPAATGTAALLSLAQTWTAVQTFGNDISFGGAQLNVSSLATNDLLQYNGTNWVNVSTSTLGVNVKEVGNASETELTTTSATTVATFTPAAAGNFMVMCYARVITAATTVTLELTWNDVTGAQTFYWQDAVSDATGSYMLPPAYINAATSAAIDVIATAGTANQVYVSATIIQIT